MVIKLMQGLTPQQAFIKRLFDVVISLVLLITLGWLIFIAFILASIDTKSNGFFRQLRVGQHGKLFNVVKIKTMKPMQGLTTSVTVSNDPRITALGRFWRKTKIDELPQLWNVLVGEMSFVGPRPDVPGFADQLKNDDRQVLLLKPGITGPATLKYRNEEALLAQQDNPEQYNREVIFPDKVNINREYMHNWRFGKDIAYIWQTAVGVR